MKKALLFAICALGAGLMLTVCGNVDEDKPLEQVKAEAAKWDADKLEDVIEEYTEAIEEKAEELKAELEKLKEIPLTEITGEKAKAIKAETEKLTESIAKMKKQLEAYAEALKAKAAK